jgi:hypothetical protein
MSEWSGGYVTEVDYRMASIAGDDAFCAAGGGARAAAVGLAYCELGFGRAIG